MRIPAPTISKSNDAFSLAVLIGFQQTTYSVFEGVGDAVVKVGIIIGSLETEIVVRLTTADDSAVCKFWSQPKVINHVIIYLFLKLLMTM